MDTQLCDAPGLVPCPAEVQVGHLRTAPPVFPEALLGLAGREQCVYAALQACRAGPWGGFLMTGVSWLSSLELCIFPWAPAGLQETGPELEGSSASSLGWLCSLFLSETAL